MSILGNRVLRLEDPRFLRGEGRYVENLDARGRALVTFVRSPLAHARVNGDRRLGGRGAAERPGLHRRGRRRARRSARRRPGTSPPGWSGRSSPGTSSASRATSSPSSSRRTAPSGSRRGGAGARGLRPAAGRALGRGGADGRGAALPGRRDERREPRRLDGARRRAVRRLRRRRLGRAREPAAGGRARSSRARRRPWWRRRPSTLWATSQTPHAGQDGRRGLLGLDPATGARRRARTSAAGSAPSGSSAEGVLVAWLARKLDRPCAGPRRAPRACSRSRQGRGQRLEFTLGGTRDGKCSRTGSRCSADAGAYPALGAILPNLTALMSTGVYAIPKIEVDAVSVVTNTTPIDPVPRRGPARGGAGDRARDRPVRGRGRARPGRGAAAELHPEGRVPVHDGDRRDLRLAATTRARSTSLLRAAGYDELRAEQRGAAREGDADAARDRARAYVEITNPRRRGGVRRGRDHRGRRRDRAHRLVLARPGPRDHASR